MKIKKVIDNNTTANNLFTFSFTHTDDKGTYTHNINVSDIIAKMRYGDRKVNKYLEHIIDVVMPAHFYTIDFPNVLNELGKVYAYKWHSLLYTESLYYNPLFNVDGVEVTRTDLGQRQNTDNYGQDKTTNAYAKDKNTNTIGATENTQEYAQDKTTNVLGKGKTTDTLKTNPYNDSSVEYTTNLNTSETDSKTDSTTRDAHTDTFKSKAHTDTIERDARTDTVTRDDRTDIHTTLAVTDTVTYTRQGNIGVTKTQELIHATIDLDFEPIYIILDDIMKNITRGY